MRLSLKTASAIGAAVLVASPSALAQDGSAVVLRPPPPPFVSVDTSTPVERHWYGWQIFAADGAAAALVSIGAAANDDGSSAAGFLTYGLGGPTVHWVHGRIGIGFASLPIRLVSPMVAMWAFGQVGGCDRFMADCDTGPTAAMIVGAVAASITDAGALAFERRPAAPSSRPYVVPSVSATPTSLVISVSGTTF